MKSKKVIAIISSLLMLTGMIPGTVFAEDSQASVGEPASTQELQEVTEYSGELPELTRPRLFGLQEGTGEAETFDGTWYPSSICTESEWLLLYGVNKLRASQGVEPLSTFGTLQQTARLRAGELSSLFSHTRPDGTDCWTAYDETGVTDLSAKGENIAYGTTSPIEVFTMWANSPGHLANMLDSDFTHLGMAQNDIYWTQNFGGSDGPTSISVVNPSEGYRFPQNYSIDDFGILLELEDIHGTSYMPLIEEMCTNLDKNAEGIQTVTIEYRGVSTTINVMVDKPWYFTDVPSDAWFYNNVYVIYNLGIMTGLNETTFGPADALGRGQFATILYRIDGSPEVPYENVYPDVEDNKFYTSPAMWGKANGIITGYQNGNFGAADKITREQVATILYRYASAIELDTSQRADLSSFPDQGKISGFAREALEWAVGIGVISGDGGKVNPQNAASRAQCATMILRFLEYYN